MNEDNVVMLVGLMMDRMGIDSITLTKQDMAQFEGSIQSFVNESTNSCTITRIK